VCLCSCFDKDASPHAMDGSPQGEQRSARAPRFSRLRRLSEVSTQSGQAAIPRHGDVEKTSSDRRGTTSRLTRGWNVPLRYEVKTLIGQGSYGFVFECFDNEKGRNVAIKRIEHLFDDLVDCKRTLRELAIGSRMAHSRIVELYDLLLPDNLDNFNEISLVMEMCDSDLRKLCRSRLTLSPLQVNTLLYNILVGVRYLHASGVYHRDLKPANCLVNRDCVVKLCDFGLARVVLPETAGDEPVEPASSPQPALRSRSRIASARPPRHKGTAVKRSLTGHVVTRWYRAPELILLQTNYSCAVDMWSVGCILAELLQIIEGADLSRRGPVCQGTSCFPMSPSHSRRSSNDKRDQLNIIFDLIGTPSTEETNCIADEDLRQYVQCFRVRSCTNFRERFSMATEEGLDALRRMLQFSPSNRLTVGEAIEHALLKTIRNPELESELPAPLDLDFETLPDLNFRVMRRFITSEIQKYH